MSPFSSRAALLLTAAVLTSPIGAAEPQVEVSIEQVQWGFDGKAQPHTFVPLSVLVQNRSPNEFEGTLRLTKSLQLSQPIDAAIEQDVYLGPLSSRWVQIVPYVFADWEQWQLTWVGLDTERFSVRTPSLGDRATVLVYDPDQLQSSGGILHRLPSNLFPSSVTALDGLRGIVFDRPPGWQGARREAFLDWLQLGGRVYLLQNTRGEYPTFPENLSLLNRDSERFTVGSGVVRRIPQSVASLDADFIRDQILDNERGNLDTSERRRVRETTDSQGMLPLMNRNGWDRDSGLLWELQSLSRYERNWIVVYGLALLYLLALFPGCYWLGRRLRTYEWFYAGFFLMTGVFSVGFASLGRLGASDLPRIRAVAIAHQLDEGVYDVTGWSSGAARVSGDYTIRHEGTGRLYAAGSEVEPVQGRIVNGPEGRLEANMPAASTRTAIHRTRAEGPSLGLRIDRIAVDAGRLSQLSLSMGEEGPEEPLSVHVFHDTRLYKLEPVGDEWQLVPGSRTAAADFLSDFRALPLPVTGIRSRPVVGPTDEEKLEEDFESLRRPLIGNSFGLNNVIDPLMLTLDPELLRVFVYAAMPQAFAAIGEDFPDQQGCVLYVVDLSASVTPRGSGLRAPASSTE